MNKLYLNVTDLPAIESLRTSMNHNLGQQTIEQPFKADFRIKFEKWINEWTASAYWEGVTDPAGTGETP